MKFALIILLLFCGCDLATAQVFSAPKTHPIDRYETDWQKNPFTLKTAPAAINHESFAKDLALAGISSSGDITTVILVNTRTREYMRLRNHDPAPSGLRVKQVSPSERRAEIFAELELNHETAFVRFDESFLKQIASNQAQPASPVTARNPALATPANATAVRPPSAVAMNTQPTPIAPDVTQIPLPVIGGGASPTPAALSQSGQSITLRRTLRTAPIPHPQADQ